MEITSAILCDFAQVREGLLFVVSGGITRVFHPQDAPWPQPLGLHLAITIEVGPDELAKVHELRARVTRQSTGDLLGQAVGALQSSSITGLEPGEAATVSAAIPLVLVPLPALGAYDVHVSADGMVPRILTVYVKKAPPGVKYRPIQPLSAAPPPQGGNRQQRRHPNQPN